MRLFGRHSDINIYSEMAKSLKDRKNASQKYEKGQPTNNGNKIVPPILVVNL